MRIAPTLLLAAALALDCSVASAQTTVVSDDTPQASATSPSAGDIVDMDTVLVSGRYAGPALWKVVKDGNALWILGTVNPVPKRMEWYSPEAEEILAQAQELIGAPAFIGDVGVSGMFKMAFAMPTMLRARNNPDGKTLEQVLPPDLYARWAALKPVYLGNDRDVEKRRPMFAAAELYQAAIKRAGLATRTGVGERIGKLVKQHGVKSTQTQVQVRIKDPKGLAKSFSRSDLDDVQCFRNLLDRLELDVASAAQRANAWAVGDLAEIKRLFGASMTPCYEALAQTEAAREMGMGEGMARSEAQWLDAAEKALATNATTFAVLPMSQLLEADGLLARLQRRGYEVVVPE
jgi:hypothetical protein